MPHGAWAVVLLQLFLSLSPECTLAAPLPDRPVGNKTARDRPARFSRLKGPARRTAPHVRKRASHLSTADEVRGDESSVQSLVVQDDTAAGGEANLGKSKNDKAVGSQANSGGDRGTSAQATMAKETPGDEGDLPKAQATTAKESSGGDPFPKATSHMKFNTDPKNTFKGGIDALKTSDTDVTLDTPKVKKKIFAELRLVIASAVCAAVAVVLTARLGECCARPSRAVPTDEERLKAELEESKKLTASLEQALVERHRKQEKAAAADQTDKPGEQVGIDNLDREALVGGMHARSRDMETQLQDAVESLELDKMMRQAEQLKGIFSSELTAVQDRAKEWGSNEAKALFEKVQMVSSDELLNVADKLGATGDAAAAKVADAKNVRIEKMKAATENFASFGLLVSASFAPSLIQRIYGTAQWRMMFNAVSMATVAGLATASWKKPCADLYVWYWAYGIFGVAALGVMANAIVSARAGAALASIEESRVLHVHYTGNPIWDHFLNIKSSTRYLFKALFVYDTIRVSYSYHTSQLVSVMNVIVGGFGVYVSIAHVREDAEHCQTCLVTFLHILSFVYVLLFSWTILGLALWLLQVLATSMLVKTQIVKLAMHLDDGNVLGVPLFVTLARSLVLRSPLDLVTVQRKIAQEEIEALEAQAEEVTKMLEKRKTEAGKLEALEDKEKESEEQLIQKYTHQVNEGLNALKPVVSLAAAHQTVREQAPLAAAAALDKAKAVDVEALKASAAAAASNLQEQASAAAGNLQDLKEQAASAADNFQKSQEQAAAAAGQTQEQAATAAGQTQEQAAAAADQTQEQAKSGEVP